MTVTERKLQDPAEVSAHMFQLKTELDWIRQAERRIKEALRIKGLKSYSGLESALNRFCSLGIYGYLRASHIDVAKGRTYDSDDLKNRLAISDKFDKFYKFMVNALREDGFVRIQNDRIEFLKDEGEIPDLKKMSAEMEVRYPQFKGLLKILQHCIGHYRQALSGEIAAISVLYPDGTSRLLDESSADTVEYEEIGVYQLLAQEVIGRLLRKSNPKPLRILEVGGGRGMLTRLIAPALKDRNVEYHFTDIGRSFVAQAKKDAEKSRFDFMKFGLLDISRDPQRQEYKPFSFDVVLGQNVVHATPSIEESLRNLKTLLTPNGVLLLIESVKSYRWHDMIWGLAEGWWYFNDTNVRTDTPLLSPDKWDWVLRQSGFRSIQIYPQNTEERAFADSSLIIAQQSTSTAGKSTNATRASLIERNSLIPSRETQQKNADIRRDALPRDRAGGPKCIHELIEAQVDRTPEAIAVTFQDQQLTYWELNQRANRLAHRLRSLGVGPEITVGICMERSHEVIVAILAILKAGASYVPLDPGYPKDRLGLMLNDSKAAVLLTKRATIEQFSARCAQVVYLDEDQGVGRDSETNLHAGVSPGNLAYVIYTSGSTGTPKGVLVTHHNLVHSTRVRTLYYREPVTSFLLLSSFAFDSSVAGIFWTLCQGGMLVLPQQGLERDVATVQALITKNQVSHMLSVPSLYGLLLEGSQPQGLSSLRTVIVAGEVCPDRLVRRHRRINPQAALFNEYGPTEATVWCSAHAVNLDSDLTSVPIGRPIPGTQIHLLDPHLRPVAVGVPGELFIGGIGIARGYMNHPQLTAEKFIPDPFADERGARLYKTGDLGRRLADGNIEFLGRIDHQVKISGFRIELGEIEVLLAQHPALRETAVLAHEDEAGDLRLVAYGVLHREQTITLDELRTFVKERLPEYMVPSAFVPLEAMPLSPNGKIDRRALPPPSRERPVLVQPYVGPRNALEQWLTGMWCDTLKLDSVGIHDKFFELGGSSLQAARLINRIQKELGESVFVLALFDAPSIAEFAAFLRSHYAHVLAERFPSEFSANLEVEREWTARRIRRVDKALLTRMRGCVPALNPSEVQKDPQWQCRRAIFILAPPRSGTTLLRVMLAGHPDLFAAPELQLLGFHTLQQRKAALSGRFTLWLEGTLRTVMEIKGCDADEAKRIVESYERQGLTTKDFYRLIQDWIAPRTLVDKTPSYALDIEALRKAERDFSEAAYIHLIRHPYAAVRSFESDHLDQALFLRDHDFAPRELGELVWTVSHQNILEFLNSIPPERQYRMRFEDLTRDPRSVIEAMCARLGLEFHPDVVDPYKNKERKMIDGLYEASTPMGDRKFLEYDAINPRVAENWRRVSADNFLGHITWDVAESLGYDRPEVPINSVRGKGFAVHPAATRIGRSHMERVRQIRSAHRDTKPKE